MSIVTALEKLGGDAESIATELHRMGIKGEKHSCHSCPIAIHIKRETGLDCKVDDMIIYRGAFTSLEMRTPPAVLDFIEKFDGGDYPELVRRYL